MVDIRLLELVYVCHSIVQIHTYLVHAIIIDVITLIQHFCTKGNSDNIKEGTSFGNIDSRMASLTKLHIIVKLKLVDKE